MAELNQIVEQLSTLSVLEAAELVKLLEEKWGRFRRCPDGDGYAWRNRGCG